MFETILNLLEGEQMSQIRAIRKFQEEPMLLHCGKDVNLKPGARFGPVIRDVYIFECNVDGYGSVIINGREFPVRPGDFYILLPGDTITHTAAKVNPRIGFWCAASGRAIGHILNRAGITSTNPFAPSDAFSEALEQMETMFDMSGRTDPGSELLCTACLYRMLSALFNIGQSSDKDTIIQRAIGIMETRYSDDINTSELADAIGLERSYFSTIFRMQTGVPPHRYLTQLRIKKACALVEKGDISIAAIADAVGLDPQNFSRIFRREMGMTPLEFKKNLIQES